MYRDSQYGLTIDLAGPDGNVFALAGLAKTWDRQLGHKGWGLLEAADADPDCQNYNDVLDLFDRRFKHIEYTFLNDPRESHERELSE